MSTTVKWILGILAALIVLSAIAGAAYLIFTRWQPANWMMAPRAFQPWDSPREYDRKDLPRGMPFRDMPMHRYWNLPFWGVIGFLPFRLLGWLFSPALLFLALIAVAAYFIGRGSRKPAAAPPAPQPAPARACPACSRPVQADWSHCPYCGSALE